MTRVRLRFVLASASACFLLMAVLVTARGQQSPAANAERNFSLGDSDLDGKLSLDEFRELLVYGPRFKKAAAKKMPARPEALFERLDTDHDGFLTFLEFRRINQMRPGGPNGGGWARSPRPAWPRRRPSRAARRSRLRRGRSRRGPPPPSSRSSPSKLKFFETKIRPVLMTKCAKCHASDAEKVKGGLLVDSREGLRKGGDTGPAVVPGNLDESLLITAIRYKDDSLQMPPKTKLPDEVVADFEKWVKMGAPDPRGGAGSAAAAQSAVDVEKGRQFWAFQPPRAVSPAQGQRHDLAEVGHRSLPAFGSRGQGPEARRRRRPARLDSPRQLRPDRPAPGSRGGPGVRRRYLGRRVREGGRPAAGLAAVRRALGAALARPGAVRRIERQRQHDVSPGLAIPRLGHRRVQRRQAV